MTDIWNCFKQIVSKSGRRASTRIEMWPSTATNLPHAGSGPQAALHPNGRFDASVGVFASLAAVMSAIRPLRHAAAVGGNVAPSAFFPPGPPI